MSERDDEQPQLPLVGAGPRLKAAREAAELSRADIAAKTRISERLIVLMEAGEFAKLPSRTYATGFTRTYARIVGLDAEELVDAVRRELGMTRPLEVNAAPSYEPGDPARVPSARFAWLLALFALGILVAGLFFWRNYYAPAWTLPSILPTESPADEPTVTTDLFAPTFAPTLDPAATFSPTQASDAGLNAGTAARPAARNRRSDPPRGTSTASPGTFSVPAPALPDPAASTVSN